MNYRQPFFNPKSSDKIHIERCQALQDDSNQKSVETILILLNLLLLPLCFIAVKEETNVLNYCCLCHFGQEKKWIKNIVCIVDLYLNFSKTN